MATLDPLGTRAMEFASESFLTACFSLQCISKHDPKLPLSCPSSYESAVRIHTRTVQNEVKRERLDFIIAVR